VPLTSRLVRARTALAAAGLLALAPVLLADGQQGQTFRTGTDLVEVDVVVRDKDGNPVRGLRPEDFTLLDRGKPVTVTAFEEVARGSAELLPSRFPPTMRVDVATNTAPAASRLVAIVLDDLHTYKNRTDTVKEISRDVVAKLGQHSSMAVIFTSGDDGVEVTSDRSRILEAIDRFAGRKPVPKPMVGCDPQMTFVEPGTLADMGCDIQETYSNLQSFEAMQHAARLLVTGRERRKAFVMISEGMAKDLWGLFDVMQSRPPPIQGSADNVVVSLSMTAPTPIHEHALLDMMEAMRRSNVATYAIDPRGLVESGELLRECFPDGMFDPCMRPTAGEGGPEAWYNDVRQSQDTLTLISEGSGGFGIVNTDDFTGGIDRILTDLDNFYLLGFTPADRTTPGYRRLEVKVNRSDVELRYRRGYDMRPLDDQLGSSSRDPLTNMLSRPLATADVPLRLSATVLPRSATRSRVAITIEITEPRADLEESGLLRDAIRYSVAAIDLKGAKVAEHFGNEILFALRPRPGAPTDVVTYQLLKAIELPPGRYQLRAALESDQMGAGGSVFLPLDVPDFRDADLVVSPLTLGYADGSRVPQAPTEGQSLRYPRALPPAAQILPFTPTLDREFVSSDVLWLYFEFWRAEPRQDVATRLVAIDESDRIVASFDQTVAARDDGKVGMKLPLDRLTPGAYRLRVLASDGERLAQQEVGILVK